MGNHHKINVKCEDKGLLRQIIIAIKINVTIMILVSIPTHNKCALLTQCFKYSSFLKSSGFGLAVFIVFLAGKNNSDSNDIAPLCHYYYN